MLKVLVGDQQYTEGFSFYNTLFAHIYGTPLSSNERSQAIGRIRRLCSHTAIPSIEDRVVRVFTYVATHKGRLVGDGAIMQQNLKEAAEFGKIEEIAKRSAIDCMLHSELTGAACAAKKKKEALSTMRFKKYLRERTPDERSSILGRMRMIANRVRGVATEE